jgi:DNA-binding response OmpR family regulator
MNSKVSRTEKIPLIFMLEQDPDDRELTEMISKETGFNIDFRFFAEQSRFFQTLSDSKTLPRIIILSYNSIPDDAVTVLKSLKADKRFMHIPVIILSDSITDNALHEAYEHGANSYIRKPFTNSDTINKIATFLNYWLNVVELPSQVSR